MERSISPLGLAVVCTAPFCCGGIGALVATVFGVGGFVATWWGSALLGAGLVAIGALLFIALRRRRLKAAPSPE